MKKIKTYFLIFLIIPISYFFAACQKEKTGTDGIVVPGNISLEVHAVHHNWDVSGITIYLEKNVTDFPGKDSTIYDIKGIADGYGIFTFEHLHPGNYYVYASGYDAIWGTNVIGYMPAVINSNTVTDNELKITLIVSE